MMLPCSRSCVSGLHGSADQHRPEASANQLRGYGNPIRATTLESRQEELGVLRPFSRPLVSNDNPYSGSLFGTVKYRPDYPRNLSASKDQACQWIAMFVDWYNHQHRHSGIKCLTPQQRNDGQVAEICRHRTVVYEQARQRNLRPWTRSTRCWRQSE
jgi:putative transposase